jgi:hypothetical protein
METANMSFENLVIEEVCLHQIFQRGDDRVPVPPQLGTSLLALTDDARATFAHRVTVAVGREAQCMEMTIAKSGPESAVSLASKLMSATPAEFVELSQKFATALTSAQTSRTIPGGMLAVFRGHSGYPVRKLVGVIKAEMQEGFRATRALQVEYFRDLFLTRQTKLYKLGIFRHDGTSGQLPSGWAAVVYDSQMSQSEREAAALYFYEGFLGLGLPQSAARSTKEFFRQTRDFISSLEMDEEEKADLYTSLYTYLKVDQSPTIQVSAFGAQTMNAELADAYAAYMANNDFPAGIVPKDLSEVGSQLKRRRMRFARDLQLTGPAEAFKDLVEISTLDTATGPWTNITIKGPIEAQE